MLRMVLNINWRDMIRNTTVYGDLPKVTEKIRDRRMKLAGHIQRHEDLIAHEVLFWDPQHGRRGRGRPQLTYIDMLKRDTELDSVAEIKSLMLDRELWRKSIQTRAWDPT